MSSTSYHTSRELCRGLSVVHWGLMVLMVSSVVQADQRFCGKQLVTMLSMLCDEFPDLHYGVKKSMIDFDKIDYPVDDWMSPYGQDQDTMISNDLIVSPNHVMTDQQQQSKLPLWVTMMYPQSYAFRSNTGRNDLIPPRFRKSPREGIVNECCLRPCGINQLLKYCKKVA
ncbi:uncharacterized protein LOC129721889 isoform X4 [Wyeomyia smithii]|uniref:uncharacterized protein LOC129721889 isoform X4 n=1 Tax=Wyeomyia smithii TaxID=174621 RepID=UPI002467EA8B|nr:uncharacterized protein LOC129721889 isoform X4 [Wyeomyia smithii]